MNTNLLRWIGIAVTFAIGVGFSGYAGYVQYRDPAMAIACGAAGASWCLLGASHLFPILGFRIGDRLVDGLANLVSALRFRRHDEDSPQHG